MAALAALYLQDPFWIWLALACVFVALCLATGSARLVLPGIVASLVALAEVAGLRAGLVVEILLFLVLSAAALGGLTVYERRRGAQGDSAPSHPTAPAQYQTPAERKAAQTRNAAAPVTTNAERQARSERLIGRIGKTTSEFANGVGRVWIDNAEWGAELTRGSISSLPSGSPVRIVKVIGGIRLQVESLQTR